MVKLTRDFIFQNRTENGAWTYAQLEALGVVCPPQKGWIYDLEGKEISEERARLFAEGKTLYNKRGRKEMRAKLRELENPTKSALQLPLF